MDITNNLIKIFNNNNIEITKEKAEKFNYFNNLMLNYNKIHNLTTITEENNVILKHYLDSVLIYKYIPDDAKIIDLGCGGGFPSIPLKIMNENINITATDSVKKKTNFVELAKNELTLDNFTVINARIEDLATKSEFREKFDIVVSRALAPLPTIIEYSAPFLKDNGIIISYKGSNYQEEINISSNALSKLNCKISEIKEFYIKELDLYRYFIIIEKIGKIDKKYPRNQNKPRLQPL